MSFEGGAAKSFSGRGNLLSFLFQVDHDAIAERGVSRIAIIKFMTNSLLTLHVFFLMAHGFLITQGLN